MCNLYIAITPYNIINLIIQCSLFYLPPIFIIIYFAKLINLANEQLICILYLLCFLCFTPLFQSNIWSTLQLKDPPTILSSVYISSSNLIYFLLCYFRTPICRTGAGYRYFLEHTEIKTPIRCCQSGPWRVYPWSIKFQATASRVLERKIALSGIECHRTTARNVRARWHFLW